MLDEEDSHLCIRCNQTIIGLQNYVNHRQGNHCGNPNAKSSTKHFTENFDFLNSHDEKKIENYANFHFDDERDDDETDDDDDAEISETNNKSTESEYKEYDYDFFSSLELQCMSKREMPHAHQTGGKNFNHRILTRKATAAIIAQQGDEWIDSPEPESDDDSEESEPEIPDDYTRGKWKPDWVTPSHENESSNEANLDKSIELDDNPPPDHTKGKWIPGHKITKLEFKAEKIVEKMSQERNNFWCSYCSRNLATRANYERHLKSNLHEKRTKQQNELEEAAEILPLTNRNELSTHFTRHDTSTEATTVEMLDRVATSTPISKPCEGNSALVDVEAENENDGKIKPKKFRSRTKVTCEECDIKLPVHLLGKHLISHFHYRKMLQNPKKSFDTVLNNLHKIIIQSPFQCQLCKFYFNFQEDFLRHWNSIEHINHVSGLVGVKFLCSFCKFECSSHGEMTDHLNGIEHQQVVALINRSKPIIIRALTPLRCKQCHIEFRYNIQLMNHRKTCESKTNDDDRSRFTKNFDCDTCQKVFQSGISLQRHKSKVHNVSVFFCSECQMTFKTALEAKVHRRTSQHKALASRKKLLIDPQLKARLRKICPICNEEKLDILELKQHILDTHPDHKFSCSMCGMKFALPQEISRHVRDKVCKFYNLNKAIQSSPTCSSSEGATTSQTTTKFPVITSNSIKYQTLVDCGADNDKVLESPCIMSQDMDLIENNLNDILSPTFQMNTSNDNDFETIIGEIDANEQAVEIHFTCKLCTFSTHSHAEFLFHEILHQLPDRQSSKAKIKCQFCQKHFRKQSLREHLRQHTNERIFECPIDSCPMSFTRKANLKNHINNMHKKDNDSSATPSNVCQICGKKFQSKYILDQHKFLHRSKIATKTFPCMIQNCIYIGRNSTDTRNHLLTHNDERLFVCTQPNCDYRGQTMEQLRSHSRKHQELQFRFSCESCDYKTKLPNHLKRHMRVHEKEKGKIFKCPYCEYACNTSENLRKHVLKTSKHAGRYLYECGLCSELSTQFKSNFLKEYQSHQQQSHGKHTIR